MSSPEIPAQHRAAGPSVARCAVLTISDTRTLATDRGGALLVELLTAAGQQIVARAICPDDPQTIQAQIRHWQTDPAPDVMLLTGGTGISARDQTYETLCAMLTKSLPGYGELFRWLSYQQIGPAAMLSRALGGIMNTTLIFSMPGSPAAVQLAIQQLILPELPHLLQQVRS